MTLSPGPKVQPKRSTLSSPGGFSAACSSMLSDRAPSPPRFIGHSTWTSRIGSSPKRAGMRSRTTASSLRDALLRLGRVDEVEVRARRPGAELGHLALVDPVRVDDDPALGRLAEHLGQPHHRHGARADDVGQHLARARPRAAGRRRRPAAAPPRSGSARSSARISGTSTIEVSSTTSRSHSSGFVLVALEAAGLGVGLQQAVDGPGLQPGASRSAAWPPGRWGRRAPPRRPWPAAPSGWS